MQEKPTTTDLMDLLDVPVARTSAATASRMLTGQIEDTHNPCLPARVLVRWVDDGRTMARAWLPYVQGIAPRRGDHVLLGRPDNDPGWIVTAVLAGEATRPSTDDDARVLRLEPGQRVRIHAHDGTALLELGGGADELVVHILTEDLTLDVPGRLRLRGRGVEIEGGRDGVGLRTMGEAIVRGGHVRIN